MVRKELRQARAQRKREVLERQNEPQDLSSWLSEQQSRYKDYVGVDPFDTSTKTFTEEEMIERYARNLVFWDIERLRLGEIKLDQYDLPSLQKLSIVDNGRSNTLQRSRSIFNSQQIERIMFRKKSLVDMF